MKVVKRWEKYAVLKAVNAPLTGLPSSSQQLIIDCFVAGKESCSPIHMTFRKRIIDPNFRTPAERTND